MAVFSIVLGVLMLIGGFSLMATPLITFVSTGYYIIALFFISGLFGIVRGITDKQYGLEFGVSILSLILGIAGFVIPGAAAMNNFVILYMAALWFICRGIVSILTALNLRKLGASTGTVALGVILGVLELILAVYSAAHPAVLALTLGLLIGFYFVESGIDMIVLGTVFAKLTSGNGR